MLGGLLSGRAEKIADVTARVTHPPDSLYLFGFSLTSLLALLASIHFLSPFLPNVQREPLFCPSAGLLFISQAAVAALQ